jgi:bifunctional non-homologous end joining protein LigD
MFRITFRKDFADRGLSPLWYVVGMAFQRKKPAAIGCKAPYPGFIEPTLATTIEHVSSGER